MERLRFKDENGNEYPEWKNTKFGEFLTIPKKEKAKKIDKNKILTVKLHCKGVCFSNNTKTLSIGSTVYYLRKTGQFIYGKQNFFNGAFGFISTQHNNGLTSGDVPSLDIDETIIDKKYFIDYIGRSNYYKSIEKYTNGTGSKRLHEKQLLALTIKLPSLLEQQKIGGFFSAIDKLIDLQKKKIELLKLMKKGYLQKMFNQELRFKDENGKDYPEWKTTSLEEISISSKYGVSNPAVKFSPKKYRYLRITDIDEEGNLIESSKVSVEGENLEDYLLEDGDICFARTGASTGKNYLHKSKNGKFVFAGFLIRFRINKKIAYPQFIINHFRRSKFVNWIQIMSARSGQPGINLKEYSSYQMDIPKMDEQEKIGNFLQSIQDVIELNQSKLHEYERIKKGYIQRLFVEVTNYYKSSII